jgi:flagellar basal-body rod protein FlgC
MQNNFLLKKDYIFISFFIIFLFLDNKVIADDDYIYNNIYTQFLIENNIPIISIGDEYFVDENIEENDLNKFFELLVLSAEIIVDNIANYNTTRTSDYGPFRRNKIIIIDGQINIIKDYSVELRFVYDPSHPDSILNGDRRGYVQYSNVDIALELVNLLIINKIYEKIIEECRLKNINVLEKYIAVMDFYFDIAISEIPNIIRR